MPVKKDPNDNKPWITNYPTLHDWLDKIDAQCMWQKTGKDFYVEGWRANGRAFVLVVYGNKMGWHIYTEGDSGRVDETLSDAEKRLGIDRPDRCPLCLHVGPQKNHQFAGTNVGHARQDTVGCMQRRLEMCK